MDNIVALDLSVFVIGALAAAFVTGIAGFAFGLVAAAIWLHALPPIETTTLIVAYGLVVQGYAVWKLRQNLNASRLIPLIVGSVIGVPLGILALRWVSTTHLRMAVGILLVLFSLYNLIRPKLPVVKLGGRSCRCLCWFPQWCGRWIDRACGHPGGYLEQHARLAER